MGASKSSAPAVAATVPTKAPTMADTAVQAAYSSARRRYAAAGTGPTILTSGSGDVAVPVTLGKTLLGQ
ncbi:MAG: hypothetical protein RBR34_06755 [Rhodospirillaceae bacterium]|nr:hypothetical protein [Rhodospirillaceae bacterium]